MLIVENIVIALINAFMEIFLVSKILDRKLDYKDIKNILLFLLLAAYIFTSYILITNAVRIIITFVVFTIVNKLIFKDSIMRIVLASGLCLIILFLSETVYVLLSMKLLSINIEKYKEIFLNSIIGNLFVFLGAAVLVSIRPVQHIFNNIVRNISNKIDKSLIACLSLILATFSILLFIVYFNVDSSTALCLNIIIITMYSIIGYFLVKEKHDNIDIHLKYETATENLKDYESLIDKQRKDAHNIKNDLISIKGMLHQKEESNDILEYIDDILKDHSKDDQAVLDETMYIPSGGLQGLVYQKLLVMKSKRIDYAINIDDRLKKVKSLKLNTHQNKDLCTVIGIYLDNAIEETEKLDNKEIKIAMRKEGSIITIEISNTYQGKLDFIHLEDDGYSSKGIGRGHGLNIAREIIKKEKIMENKKRINGQVFTQILNVKI